MPHSNLPALESVEARLARRLPSAFREFILRGEGGEIELLGLPWEVGTVEEIISITEQARKWPSFPPGGVSVGDDGCGNHLVFVPNPQDPGSFASTLYVWWHETGEVEMIGADFDVG